MLTAIVLGFSAVSNVIANVNDNNNNNNNNNNQNDVGSIQGASQVILKITKLSPSHKKKNTYLSMPLCIVYFGRTVLT